MPFLLTEAAAAEVAAFVAACIKARDPGDPEGTFKLTAANDSLRVEYTGGQVLDVPTVP